MSIGNLFVRLREHRGYSQTLAAKVLGIPKNTLCSYENGSTTPSLERYMQIIRFYGLNAALAVFEKETIDITEISPIGKQKIEAIIREEQEKKRKEESIVK